MQWRTILEPNEAGQEATQRKLPVARSPRRDQTLLDAVEQTREWAVEIGGEAAVGEHLGAIMVGDRLALHRFESLNPGYPGWVWEVSVARAPRSKKVTVCEVDLIPGSTALLAPEWVPWSERLEPSDVSRTDVLPYEANDPRLLSGFEQTEELEADAVAFQEMGLGRKRVLSQEGLDLAAARWYDSPIGPTRGLRASEMCASCGFLVKLSGSLGTLFGVCANEWSPDDGKVVAFDHGCGAHSETDQPKRRAQWPIVPPRVDDFEMEAVVHEPSAATPESNAVEEGKETWRGAPTVSEMEPDGEAQSEES